MVDEFRFLAEGNSSRKTIVKSGTVPNRYQNSGAPMKTSIGYACFKLSVPEPQGTKQKILSYIARCYDPIGLIRPFIFYLKLFVKELWRLKLGWDDEPPREISKTWDEGHKLATQLWSWHSETLAKKDMGRWYICVRQHPSVT
ncbi:hypothetical protein JTB14_034513 [Gonioctena quinquepunctata]|nr:hypothetical protein JTB14_034513 [Gonioctena quinquepunctata]